MPPVTLPDLPKGKAFEEYISSIFQSCGYYTERQIIEREVEEVLELDVVITDYDQFPPHIKLSEVKSGEWDFRDLFKLRGWMDYLGFGQSLFVANKGKDNIDFFVGKCRNLGIDLVVIPDLTDAKHALHEYAESEEIDDADVAMWRFSYWVERNLMERLKRRKKSQQNAKRYKALEDYYFDLNSGIFFTEKIIERLARLYSTFADYLRISAKCGNEVIGNDFADAHESLPDTVYRDTYYDCKYNDIQISTFVEHRARMAILKNAVDYTLYKDAGNESKTEDVRKTILGFEFSLLDSLPSSFKKGLDIICNQKYYHRYPVFWQWFMWLFGGFVLRDYEEREYEVLSQKTRIPTEEIPNALQSYDTLFPHDDGWFMDLSPNLNVRMMRLFPVPFMGIGANYRRFLYTETAEFKDLKIGGRNTLNELIKWNNLTVEVLRSND